MRRLFIAFFALLCYQYLCGQAVSDPWLEQLIRKNASPFLTGLLNQPDTFRYQLIYTKIDRDKHNVPHFTHYKLNVDADRYHNPASTVKLPVALMALERINELREYGVDVNTTMLTDSIREKQWKVYIDTSAATGLPSVAHYVKRIFLVSDNDSYNRLFELVGQKEINRRFQQMGYSGSRITRRFQAVAPDGNRYTNPVRFVKDNTVLYEQPERYNDTVFDFSRKLLIGNAHYLNDEYFDTPMDFSTHNILPLEELQQMLQSVLFPESVPEQQRFRITEKDYDLLYKYMALLPSESNDPRYDTSRFFDSYTKFFFFRHEKGAIPSGIRSFNKTGWSYGFLTDVCYIIDTEKNIEFMLTGNIYVNSDGVINDDQYDYESTGFRYFKELGEIIYRYELSRKRKHHPDLTKFTRYFNH